MSSKQHTFASVRSLNAGAAGMAWLRAEERLRARAARGSTTTTDFVAALRRNTASLEHATIAGNLTRRLRIHSYTNAALLASDQVLACVFDALSAAPARITLSDRDAWLCANSHPATAARPPSVRHLFDAASLFMLSMTVTD